MELLVRYTSGTLYFVLDLEIIIVGLAFIYRLKSYMFLYFEDFKRTISYNIMGLLVFITLYMVQAWINLFLSFNEVTPPDVSNFLIF